MDPDGPFADESMEIIDFAEQEEAFYDEDEMPDGKYIFFKKKHDDLWNQVILRKQSNYLNQ